MENPTLECHVQSCHNESHKPTSLFVPLPSKIETPVTVDNLSVELNDYPFPDLKGYYVVSVRVFTLVTLAHISALHQKTSKSASGNKAHVTDAIAKELECRHIAGPFKIPPIYALHCSPLGAVPKKDKFWPLKMDLSLPKGLSVNEWISKDTFAVTYSKFDDAVNLVRTGGTNGKIGH